MTEKRTYADAEQFCATRLYGHLADIHSGMENDFVFFMAPWDESWIGITDRQIEGKFSWTTNRPLTYTNWRVPPPSASGDKRDCVTMLSATTDPRKWKDDYCSTSKISICEKGKGKCGQRSWFLLAKHSSSVSKANTSSCFAVTHKLKACLFHYNDVHANSETRIFVTSDSCRFYRALMDNAVSLIV